MEYCLNAKPYIQPNPHKNPSGDCFACSLTAALSYLFPEKKPDFDKVWNYFMVETYGGGTALSNTWHGMQKAVVEALRDGYKIEYISDIVMPNYNLNMFSHSFWNFVPTLEYSRRLEAWLKSGWIALTEINYNGISPDTYRKSTDHFIVIDGIKTIWEPTISGSCSSLKSYTHVVCSAKGDYWIDTSELLAKHGAAAWILIRKDTR